MWFTHQTCLRDPFRAPSFIMRLSSWPQIIPPLIASCSKKQGSPQREGHTIAMKVRMQVNIHLNDSYALS